MSCESQTPDTQCQCPCHKFKGLLVILLGLVFLLGNYGVLTPEIVNTTWPILIILIGVKMLGRGFCKCCKKT